MQEPICSRAIINRERELHPIQKSYPGSEADFPLLETKTASLGEQLTQETVSVACVMQRPLVQSDLPRSLFGQNRQLEDR